MRIPMRCVLCGCVLPGWDAHHLFWGECNDCREWQAYLWPRPVQLPLEAMLAAIAATLTEGEP